MNNHSMSTEPDDTRWEDDENWSEILQGDLDRERIATIVTTCDQRPELWRRCALALMEERVLELELRRMVRSQWTDGVANGTANEPVASIRTVSTYGSVADVHAQARPQRTQAAWLSYLTMAASLVLVFSIGWQASRRLRPSAIGSPALPHPDLVTRPAVSNPSGIQLAADQGSQLPQEEINRVNADALAKAIEVRPDPEWQRRTNELRRQGYEVDAQDGIVPVLLDDGSSAVVPFQQIKIRPRRNAY